MAGKNKTKQKPKKQAQTILMLVWNEVQFFLVLFLFSVQNGKLAFNLPGVFIVLEKCRQNSLTG